jgi:hypothetical protein
MTDHSFHSESKTCTQCKQVKELSAFYKNKAARDSYSFNCKECQKLYRQQNKDKVATWKKDYYQQSRGTVAYCLRRLLYSAKTRANKSNLPFDLTMEWLETMVVSHCPITLEAIDWTKEQVVGGKLSPNSPSIDKHIPELGYVQSNCSIVSHRGNVIKSNGTIDEHRRVVQYMAAQQLRDIEL